METLHIVDMYFSEYRSGQGFLQLSTPLVKENA